MKVKQVMYEKPETINSDSLIADVLVKDMTEINRLRYEAVRNSQEIKTLRAMQFFDGDLIVQSPKRKARQYAITVQE